MHEPKLEWMSKQMNMHEQDHELKHECDVN